MLRLFAPPAGALARRPFTTSAPTLKRWMKLPPKPPVPPKEELEETFLKGSGPGGQKIVCSPLLLLLHLRIHHQKTRRKDI